jgi:hypothetical protein
MACSGITLLFFTGQVAIITFKLSNKSSCRFLSHKNLSLLTVLSSHLHLGSQMTSYLKVSLQKCCLISLTTKWCSQSQSEMSVYCFCGSQTGVNWLSYCFRLETYSSFISSHMSATDGYRESWHVRHEVQLLPTFLGSQRFISMFTRAHH